MNRTKKTFINTPFRCIIKKLLIKEASAQIKAEWMTKEEFNENSVKDYISALRHMLNGTRHTRGISTELRVFFLEKILEEYGVQKLKKALDAFMKHIEYYEGINNTHRKIEREIL